MSYHSLADGCAKRGDLEAMHRWIEEMQVGMLEYGFCRLGNLVRSPRPEVPRAVLASKWPGSMWR